MSEVSKASLIIDYILDFSLKIEIKWTKELNLFIYSWYTDKQIKVDSEARMKLKLI